MSTSEHKRGKNWLDHVSRDFKEGLAKLLEEESVRREQARVSAQKWLTTVLQSPDLEKRLTMLYQDIPSEDEVPGFEQALALALASGTLTNSSFAEYTRAREFKYWENEEEQQAIAQITEEVWSQPEEEAVSWMSQGWYNHVLNNAPKRVRQYTNSLSTIIKVGSTPAELNVVGSMGEVTSVLFDGPRFMSILLTRSEGDLHDTLERFARMAQPYVGEQHQFRMEKE